VPGFFPENLTSHNIRSDNDPDQKADTVAEVTTSSDTKPLQQRREMDSLIFEMGHHIRQKLQGIFERDLKVMKLNDRKFTLWPSVILKIQFKHKLMRQSPEYFATLLH
jgi:hypothetical protein